MDFKGFLGTNQSTFDTIKILVGLVIDIIRDSVIHVFQFL